MRISATPENPAATTVRSIPRPGLSHLAGQVLVFLDRKASAAGLIQAAYADLIAGALKVTTPQVLDALEELERSGLLDRMREIVVLSPAARGVAQYCAALLEREDAVRTSDWGTR